MAPAFTIKSNFNGDIRRTTTQSIPSYSQLASLESSMYRFANPVTLKYVDDENDAVTLANDEDVATAFAAAAAVGSFLVHVMAVETVNTSVVANINSPITTVADNPITAVPIDARVATNAPVSAVPVIGNAVTTVPISDCNSNVSPITNSPVIVTNFDGSSINNTVLNISDVNVVAGNANNSSSSPSSASPSASAVRSVPATPVAPSAGAINNKRVGSFVSKQNAHIWMPMISQLATIGFTDAQRNVDLLNEFDGNYLCVLCQLVQEFALNRRIQH